MEQRFLAGYNEPSNMNVKLLEPQIKETTGITE